MRDETVSGAPDGQGEDPDEEQAQRRAHLLPEELEAGSADPDEQAKAILDESLQRQEDPAATADEHRRSDQLVDPPD